jgi:hypothetical protein
MCSIEEAFQTFDDRGSPVRPRDRDRERDKKKERRRLKEAFSNANMRLPPPEPSVIEPDRPAHQRLPPAELLGGDPTENRESTSISQMLNAYDSEPYFPHPHSDNQQQGLYELGQDWAKVFQTDSAPSWIKDRLAQREAEVPLQPSPWMDGAPTLWQKIPSTMQGDPILKEAEIKSTAQFDDMQRKLNSMFDRLEEMDQTRAQTNHIEFILFVLGGVFLVFLLFLFVRLGMQATVFVAGAIGGSLANRGFVIQS